MWYTISCVCRPLYVIFGEASVQILCPLFNHMMIIVIQSLSLSDSLQLHGLQHTRLPCFSPSPEVCPSSCPFMWCHPAISSSDALFSFCPQSFPASRTFPVSQLFTSDDQNTGTSASVLPMSIQSWFPSRLTGLILLSKGQESSPAPQFKGMSSLALCLLCGPALTATHDHWEDHSLDCMDLCRQTNVFTFQHTV